MVGDATQSWFIINAIGVVSNHPVPVGSATLCNKNSQVFVVSRSECLTEWEEKQNDKNMEMNPGMQDG